MTGTHEITGAVASGRTDDGFDDTMRELASALTAMRRGDDGPCAALLTARDDATLFGAWGPIEQGHDQITETWQWVASRFGPSGETVQDIRVVHRGGDLAVTVGFERGAAQVDGGPLTEMVIRVTHVLRREADGWRLVHRHADFPPADPRTD
ncbi:MAG: nuclear transport factor 2 family protein [Ilumatobacteraceae bacterium]